MRNLQPFVFTVLGVMAECSIKYENTSCRYDNDCHPPFEFCDQFSMTCEMLDRIIGQSELGAQFRPWYQERKGLGFVRYTENQFVISCMEDGNYPALECNSFYRCQDGEPTLKFCDSPYFPFFDPVAEHCSSSNNCQTFNCHHRNRAGWKVGITQMLTSFFSYCNSHNNLLVTRCNGLDLFNSNSQRCEPRCLREGLLPDTSDCHRYYLCSLEDPVNLTYTMTRLTCPGGFAYLGQEYRCVPETDVPSCRDTSHPLVSTTTPQPYFG